MVLRGEAKDSGRNREVISRFVREATRALEYDLARGRLMTLTHTAPVESVRSHWESRPSAVRLGHSSKARLSV